MKKMFYRWRRCRALLRLRKAMDMEHIPLPQFYRNTLRGTKALGRALRKCSLSAEEAGVAMRRLAEAAKEMHPWPQ